MDNAYLVVGLGNPGPAYARHRHNAGFMLVDRLAQAWQANWAFDQAFSARLARARVQGRPVILCQPQTFMNASGQAVRPVLDYYRIGLDRLLVVVDDADLPFGELRLRPGGGTAGHHGLESVTQHLGTMQYPRLRIGIGRPPTEGREITGWVLSDFTPAEAQRLEKVLTRASQQVECWVLEGIDAAMSRFNGPLPDEYPGNHVELRT
jgi:PTH1 family peptidyl-tRNA hydrolase